MSQPTCTNVEVIDQAFVPLPGGVRLSARIWLPAGARESGAPVLVDYHPYRSADFSAVKDAKIYRAFAERGYACVKLDARGTGNSSGIHGDQFAEAYWEDLREALAWIGEQAWCAGRIGMTGLSWAGHAAMMAAARQFAPVAAIAPISGADDRYRNRYQGGCMMLYTVWWGPLLGGMQARPPLPSAVGEGWRAQWLERLENFRNFFEIWAVHPTDDSYWRAGSTLPELETTPVPILGISGWADTGYATTVVDLLERDTKNTSGLVGPWGHRWPHDALPGPSIDGIDVIATWFDRWLKNDGSTVAPSFPALRAWVTRSGPADPFAVTRDGYWVTEQQWPSPNIQDRTLHLAAHGLSRSPAGEATLSVLSPLSVGMHAGDWMPYYPAGPAGNLASDQREDDDKSLVFDSEPLDEDLELLGTPSLELDVSADAPDAQLVVRLLDVDPHGASTRMSYGFLNLAHREGDQRMLSVVPGERYRVVLKLFAMGYRVAKGHRLRIAVSTSYWPIVWPARDRATLSLHLGASRLILPERRGGPTVDDPALSRPCSDLAGEPIADVVEAPQSSRVSASLDGTTTLEIKEHAGSYRFRQDGHAYGSGQRKLFSIRDDDPLSARCTAEAWWSIGCGAWQTRVEVAATVTCDRDAFLCETTIRALENGKEVHLRATRARLERTSGTDTRRP